MAQISESRPIVVVINKQALTAQHLDSDEVLRAFVSRGCDARVHRVEGSEIAGIVQSALDSGIRRFAAAGGDGTVNAVATALIETEDAALALIPTGTLNHFARDLGVPTDLDQAIEVIAADHRRRIDVAEVNGHLFLNNSSIGLYPQMVARRETLQKHRKLGKWAAMMRAGWSVLRHPRTFHLTLCVNGQDIQRRTPFVFVGNNDYQIEGLQSGGRNRLDEGVLAIYVVRQRDPWGLVLLVIRAMLGKIVHGRDLDRIIATSLSVESRHASALVARDGEVDTLTIPLRYRIRPRSLTVIVPLNSENQ